MREKLTRIFCAVIVLTAIWSLPAQAASSPREALVDYWYKVMLTEGQLQDADKQMSELLQSSGGKPDLAKLGQKLREFSVSLQKNKQELETLQLDPLLREELASVQTQRIKGIEYSIKSMDQMAEFFTSQNPLMLFNALGNIQQAAQLQSQSDQELIKIAKKYLQSAPTLSKREALMSYWVDTRESEIRLADTMDKLLKFILKVVGEIQKNPQSLEKNPEKIKQQTLDIYADLEKQLLTIKSDLQGAAIDKRLAGELEPLHAQRLQGLTMAADLLQKVSQLLQKGDTSQLAKLTEESQGVGKITKEYTQGFFHLVEKYQNK